MATVIRDFRDLQTYRASFAAAMRIFEITKRFPPEERYSLTDQVRRSSRSECTSQAEAWRKRRYPAAFKAKLADAMQEASETQTRLDFALACEYIDEDTPRELNAEHERILGRLNSMDMKAESFCFRQQRLFRSTPTTQPPNHLPSSPQ
jgi:four helix bundle protein